MPQFRTPDGRIVTVPDDQADSAEASGYVPVSVEQAGAVNAARESPDRGALGGVNAFLTGGLSGATLGLSDYALKGLLNEGQFERLRAEREDHPIASSVGQIAGAVIPAFAAPESLLGSTPSGALSRGVAPLIERGIGGKLAAGAIEGAGQNAGMYLADTALGDRELSAEGLFGALGEGATFGTAGSVAALGIEKGTIAARRLFSRAAGTDKAALEAEQAWRTAHQTTVEANDAAADIAKAKLAEARAAREQAQLAKQRAGLRVVETEQAAPQIDAAYNAAAVERDQVRDAAKAAYEAAAPVAPAAPKITPQMREGLYGLGLTDADIANSAPQDLADALRMVQEADAHAAASVAQPIVPLSPAKEQSLAQAVTEHEAAKADLDDILRRLEPPELLYKGGPPEWAVPPAEWGPPGMRGYDPGNVASPDVPSQIAAGSAPSDVTAVGKKLAKGTGHGEATSAFDSKDLGLSFDAKSRTYHDPSTPWRKPEEFAPSEHATGVFEQPKPSALEDLARFQREAGEPPMGLESLVDAQRRAGQETNVGTAPELKPVKLQPLPKEQRYRDIGRSHPEQLPIAVPRDLPGLNTGSFEDRFITAFNALNDLSGGHNNVVLSDIRAALPDVSREQFDAGLRELRKSKKYSLEAFEARQVLPHKDMLEGGIKENGQNLMLVQQRDTDAGRLQPSWFEKAAPAEHAAPAEAARVFSPLSEDDYGDLIDRAVQHWTPGERSAMDAYANDKMASRNAALRRGDWAKKSADLDAAIAKTAATTDAELVRVVVPGKGPAAEMAKLRSVKPGDLYQDPGYISAWTSHEHALDDLASRTKAKNPISLVIEVPRGEMMAPLPPVGDMDSGVILPRNTRLRILESEEVSGHRVIRARVEPEGAVPRVAEAVAPKGEATAADRFAPGPNGVIPALEHPTDEAANFIIRRAREQGVNPFGPQSDSPKRFLGSLGIDWSVPAHRKTLLDLNRQGKVLMSRADLVAAMDPALVKSSQLSHMGSDFHFVSDDGRKLADVAAKAPKASGTLTGQLRGMQSKLDSGAELGKLSKESPAAAEYVANKAEQTKAAAEHFRAKANAKNYAGSGMAVAEQAANEARPSGLENLLGMQRLASEGVARDEFFSNLTRPKTRDAYVAQNIGRAMREEGSHAAALAKVEREWAEMGGAPAARGALPGHPLAVEALEKRLDDALEAAQNATTPAEVAAAEQEIRATQEQLTRVGKRPSAVDDVAAVAHAVTNYERTGAKLVEELGPDAPPAAQEAAKAFRAAEEHADRKVMDRTTRAIDDGVDSKGRPRTVEHFARKESEAKMAASAAPAVPGRPSFEDLEAKYGKYAGQPALPPTSKEAIAAAKTERQGADVAYQRAKVGETEAKIAYRGASDKAAASRAAMEAAAPKAAGPAPQSTLGAIATTIGIAGELGVPGIPKPHDIPIIGPLLGMYLKYKALKAASGRFVGRVAANGDTRAAALVARTKDKIARAVDRTLGLAAEVAPKARGPVVGAAAVLGHRIFDDGEPDAKRDATTRELAAVRIREIANASTRPELVQQYVRKELRGVVDPDLLAAAEAHLQRRFAYLASVMPKAPPPNPFTKREWLPSEAAANELSQRLEVIHNPTTALERPTPARIDTLSNVSPKLLELAKQRLIDRIGDTTNPVPYKQRIRASALYDIPLDDSLDPGSIQVIQGQYALSRPAPPPQPASPPVASIAADTNLTQMYQTGMDRRAAR